jgi:hypothetical protein
VFVCKYPGLRRLCGPGLAGRSGYQRQGGIVVAACCRGVVRAVGDRGSDESGLHGLRLARSPAAVRERAQLAGGDVLLAGPRGAVAWMLLLTGRAGEFSVFPSVGVAAFGAGLAAIATRMATDGAGKSLAAATEKVVTAAGTVTAR